MAIKIALAGNPNCGKTTMFNALTGANQYVGNWPGVTVEKKEGKLKGKKGKGEDIIVTDLPGIYSLSPYTLEEVVSRDYVLKENLDVIIDLVDATNIERNLYLTTQLIETGVPVVIALNMADLLEKRGIKIDTKRLSMLLDCPIIETSALKGEGLDKLIDEAVKTAKKSSADLPKEIFTKEMEEAISEVKKVLPSSITEDKKRWYAVKFLENDEKVKEAMKLSASGQSLVDSKRQDLEKKHDDDMESIVTDERYKFIQKIVNTTVKKAKDKLTVSDKIDRIVTNRILGIPIFVAVMWLVYYVSVTTVGTFVTDWTNDVFVVAIQDFFTNILTSLGAGDMVMGLVVDGIIGGLGAVLGFVPQMAILFLFLSILEDCGYMVRIAFVMDRVFRHFGLSGKSFIPLLISSGCGIPGIMASKTIEQDNDRRLTIMTATFIPCGAKLPVIALMGGVIAGETAGYAESSFIAPLMYFIGIVAVLVAAIILKKTKPFSGKPAPFVMELPPYRLPTAKAIFRHTWEKGAQYLRKMGGIIMIASIVIWALGYYPDHDAYETVAEQQENSYIGQIGKAMEPVIEPLGFDWKLGIGILSGVGAKELVVSTLGVLYTNDAEADAVSLAERIPITPLVAFCYMVFVLIYFPCIATIVAIKQESGSWKWALFTAVYTTLLAWVMAFAIYRIGGLFV